MALRGKHPASKAWPRDQDELLLTGCRMLVHIRQPCGCALCYFIVRSYFALRVTVNELFAGLVSVPLKLATPVLGSEPA